MEYIRGCVYYCCCCCGCGGGCGGWLVIVFESLHLIVDGCDGGLWCGVLECHVSDLLGQVVVVVGRAPRHNHTCTHAARTQTQA